LAQLVEQTVLRALEQALFESESVLVLMLILTQKL
jgi:hypothetical protein